MGATEQPQEQYRFIPPTEGHGGLVQLDFCADAIVFRILVETLGVLIGRNAFEFDSGTGGSHVHVLNETSRYQMVVLRPLGQPGFDEVPRMNGDVTRIGLFGMKKLSRSHLFIHRGVDTAWEVIMIGTNGAVVDGEKLEEMGAKKISTQSVIVSTNLKISFSVW